MKMLEKEQREGQTEASDDQRLMEEEQMLQSEDHKQANDRREVKKITESEKLKEVACGKTSVANMICKENNMPTIPKKISRGVQSQ